MFDILDMLNPKTRFTASARYYKETVDDPSIGAEDFNYEYVNPYSNTYKRLFANIQGTGGEVAIRTTDQIKFEVGGFVILQDGQAFSVMQVETDYQAGNKQALRLFGTSVSTEYVLRLVKAKNPWGVQ